MGIYFGGEWEGERTREKERGEGGRQAGRQGGIIIASDIPVSRVVVKVVSRAFHLAAPWVDLTVAVMVAWWVAYKRRKREEGSAVAG